MFGSEKKDAKAKLVQIRKSARGRLGADLWVGDPEHKRYFTEARAFESELLAATDGGRIAVDPLGRDERQTLDQWMKHVYPHSTPLGASTDSYVWSEAEAWEDFDAGEFAALLARGCEGTGGSVNEQRFRVGGSFFGVLGHHPRSVGVKGLPAFEPAWSYIHSRGAWSRLAALAIESWNMMRELLPPSDAIQIGAQHEASSAAGVLVERFIVLRHTGNWS